MALWFSLCSGFIFNKLLWRSFGGLGPGLEPGKGINYTPFSYSLSLPSLPLSSLSSLAFLALSSSSFPFLLSSFPFFLLSPFSLSLFPSVLPACHLLLGFYYSISVFCFSSPPASCTSRALPVGLSPRAWRSICPPPIPHFTGVGVGGGRAKRKQGL